MTFQEETHLNTLNHMATSLIKVGEPAPAFTVCQVKGSCHFPTANITKFTRPSQQVQQPLPLAQVMEKQINHM